MEKVNCTHVPLMVCAFVTPHAVQSVNELLSCLDYQNIYLHMNLGPIVCATQVSVCETIIALAGHTVHSAYLGSMFSPFSAIYYSYLYIGIPSTGLSTEHSSPTLVHSPSFTNKKPIGKSTSLGHVVRDSKKIHPNLSQTSLFDSGFGSLNASHNYCHCNASDGCTSPIPSQSQSCPSTPHHSVSNLSPARKHESVKQTRSLGSTPTHSAVCVSPRPLSSKTHREHYPANSSQLPTGNGVCPFCKGVVSKVSELSAVPETEDHNSNNGSRSELSGSAISSQTDICMAELKQKVDSLSEEVDRLKLNNELRALSKGIQSSLGIPESFRGRGKSEGEKAMIKKKPKLGIIDKAFSAEDAVSMHMYDKSEGECMQCLYVFFQMQHGVTTETVLLRSYSPLSSLHTERLECTVVRCRYEYHLKMHNNI